MLPLLLSLSSAHADEQRITIEVATRWRPPGQTIHAELIWLGEDRTATLCDNGTCDGDIAGDHIWVARQSGDRIRTLPVRLFVSTPQLGRTVVLERVEVITAVDQRLSYALEFDGLTPTARRVAIPAPPRGVEMNQVAQLAAWMGWAGLAFLYISWLVGRLLDAR